MLGKGLLLKTTTLIVFFLCLVKSLKDLLLISRNVALSYFENSFRSSESTADLLTVFSDRISRALKYLGLC